MLQPRGKDAAFWTAKSRCDFPVKWPYKEDTAIKMPYKMLGYEEKENGLLRLCLTCKRTWTRNCKEDKEEKYLTWPPRISLIKNLPFSRSLGVFRMEMKLPIIIIF